MGAGPEVCILFCTCGFCNPNKNRKRQKQSVPSQAPPTPGLVLGGAKETWYLQATLLPPYTPYLSHHSPSVRSTPHSLSSASIDFPTLQSRA